MRGGEVIWCGGEVYLVRRRGLFGAAAKQQVETGSGGKGYGGKFGVVPRVIRIDGKMVKDKRMEHKYFQIYGFEP